MRATWAEIIEADLKNKPASYAADFLRDALAEPLPIPAGKTVFDTFFRIRGDETEEQVYEALERLS